MLMYPTQRGALGSLSSYLQLSLESVGDKAIYSQGYLTLMGQSHLVFTGSVPNLSMV